MTGLPAAAILVACVAVSRNLPKIELTEGFDRFGWHDVVAMLPRTIAPGPLARAIVVTAGVAVALGVAGARACRTETDGADRGLGAAAILLFLVGILAPFQIPGWQAFSERFIPLGVALAVAVLPLERVAGSARAVVPAALFVASACSLVLTFPFHRRLAALCPDAIAGLSAPVSIHGAILPVTFRGTELPTHDRIDAEVPLMAPLLHMGTLYAAAHGGVAAYSFASSPAVNPFSLRPQRSPRPLPDMEHYTRAINSLRFHRDLAYRREVDAELASFGMFYDEMTVFGALPEDLLVWQERGYVADWQQGTALVAHFVPCTIDFTAPASASASPPVFDVHVGSFGLLSNVQVPAVSGADGFAHFLLAPAPCGDVSVHVRATEPCRNADVQGNILARITRESSRVSCDPQ